MPDDLRTAVIKLAHAQPTLRKPLLVVLKEASSQFTLYDDWLSWRDDLRKSGDPDRLAWRLDMNMYKAVNTSEKTFAVLERLYYDEKTTRAQLYSWASRLKDPNALVSLAYTGWKLSKGQLTRSDSEYFFVNWKSLKDDFKAFGARVHDACAERFWELAGRKTREKPEAVPKVRFQPPPVPKVSRTADGWELFDVIGRDGVADKLNDRVMKLLETTGKLVTPDNSDDLNAKNLRLVVADMQKLTDEYASFGASDGQVMYRFMTDLYKYVKSYIPEDTFPKTHVAVITY
jgi:hypothetical protein